MIKQTSSTEADKAAAETKPRVILEKDTARYIFHALLLTLVFAWVLLNLHAVLQFFGRVLAVFSPFLMGGAFAFVINILLHPMERTWRRVCKNAPEKLARPICLALSTLLVLGILFAVVFMMLPSLRESGNEFVRNLPSYADKLGQWWAGAVQFAAKRGVILPEYALDTNLLMEKITTLLHNEGSGIITVTLGAASSVLSSLVNVMLALVFALYLLAKKEVVSAHLKNLVMLVLPQKNAQRVLHIVTLTKQTFTNFVTGQLTEAVIIGVLCFLGMLILGIPYAGAVSAFVAATALIPVFGAWIGGGVSADPAAGRGQFDLPQSGGQIRWPARIAGADGCHAGRRGVRHFGYAVQCARLRGAVQPVSGIHQKRTGENLCPPRSQGVKGKFYEHKANCFMYGNFAVGFDRDGIYGAKSAYRYPCQR